jgi:DNA-binding response OmpR family regulator
LGSQKILVVEDFEDLRSLITVYLSARGYEVLEAPTGRAAIETAITGNPNFILLDLRLPDVSGVEVARELHKLPQTEHIPIVGWTADCGSKPYEEVLRRAGIIDCLEKPVSMRELEAVIQRFVPTPQG